MKKVIILSYIIATPFISLFSQSENNNWYINAANLLNFNNTPITIEDFDLYSINQGYNVSVSGSEGNLLFVTAGRDIVDKEGEIMPNGANLDNAFFPGIYTAENAFQPVAATSVIGQDSTYYLFVLSNGFFEFLTSEYHTGTLQYSIVDMRLNAGKGDIDEDQKNIFLADNLSGAMTTIVGECGEIWLLVHEYNSNRFLSFRITEEGIQEPVISDVGYYLNNSPESEGNRDNLNGIFSSPDGGKVAFFFQEKTQLFDFNQETGALSNPLELPIDAEATSGTFSPEGNYFYTIEKTPAQNQMFSGRFDLSYSDSTAIQDSKIEIGVVNRVSDLSLLQRAPDGNIYGTIERNLFVIENVDATNPEEVNMPNDFLISNPTQEEFMFNLPNLILTPCVETFVSNANIPSQDLVAQVYPNPFMDKLNVKLGDNSTENLEFSLMDITGKLLFTKEIDSSNLLINMSLISSLTSGIYFYEIKGKIGSTYGKLFKD